MPIFDHDDYDIKGDVPTARAVADTFDFTAPEGGETRYGVVLQDVLVTSTQSGGHSESGALPEESIIMNFEPIKTGADVAMEEITLAVEDVDGVDGVDGKDSAVAADRFDFTAPEEGVDAILIGLLLPAVQKVREAAAPAADEFTLNYERIKTGADVAMETLTLELEDARGDDAFFVRVDADTTTQAEGSSGAFEIISFEIGAENAAAGAFHDDLFG